MQRSHACIHTYSIPVYRLRGANKIQTHVFQRIQTRTHSEIVQSITAPGNAKTFLLSIIASAACRSPWFRLGGTCLHYLLRWACLTFRMEKSEPNPSSLTSALDWSSRTFCAVMSNSLPAFEAKLRAPTHLGTEDRQLRGEGQQPPCLLPLPSSNDRGRLKVLHDNRFFLLPEVASSHIMQVDDTY